LGEAQKIADARSADKPGTLRDRERDGEGSGLDTPSAIPSLRDSL